MAREAREARESTKADMFGGVAGAIRVLHNAGLIIWKKKGGMLEGTAKFHLLENETDESTLLRHKSVVRLSVSSGKEDVFVGSDYRGTGDREWTRLYHAGGAGFSLKEPRGRE